jgi:L-fuculose-phosphate aldolase
MISEVTHLVEVCHRVYNKGFVSAYDGNLSLRTPNNTILITRSGINKGDVTPEDIIEIDIDGKIISGSKKITTENKIHLLAYKKRKDVNAVVHCHPVFTSAFAVSRDSFPSDILPEVILILGRIPVCKYGTPSTDEVPDSLLPYIDNGWAYILQNHGAVALGKDIYDAYYKMEKLEHTARILTAASLIGGATPIPENKLEELFAISEKVYGIKINKDLL